MELQQQQQEFILSLERLLEQLPKEEGYLKLY